MSLGPHINIGRETITIDFDDERTFKCTKRRLIEAVSHFPHIYKTSRNDYNASVRSIRNENYITLVGYICNKVGFSNPSEDEQVVLEQTFRSVWRSIRDSYSKSIKLGRSRSYKYSDLMEFYRPSCDKNQPEFSMDSLLSSTPMVTQYDSDNEINSEYLNDDEDLTNKSDNNELSKSEDHNYHIKTEEEEELSSETFELIMEEDKDPDLHDEENENTKVTELRLELKEKQPLPQTRQQHQQQEQHKQQQQQILLPTTNLEYIQSNLTFLGPLIAKLSIEQVLKFLEIIVKFLRDPDSFS